MLGFLEAEVPADVATSHDATTHGRRRADNKCLVRGNGSETQIRPFNEFKWRIELDGGARVQRALVYHEMRLSAIWHEGDDAIGILGEPRLGVFRNGQRAG